MFKVLLLIFVVLPIIELTLIFKLGMWLGWIPMLFLVFGAGIVGAAIARVQGFMAAVRVREQLMHGVLPASELVDGLLIGLAGVLLILPGVISDLLGLALLVPAVRALVRRRLMNWLHKRVRIDALATWPGGDYDPPGDKVGADKIIDARVIDARVVPD